MSFEENVDLIIAVFGMVEKNSNPEKEHSEPQRPLKYLKDTIIPTENDYVDLCLEANQAFSRLMEIEIVDPMVIISWRTTYLALNYYHFSQADLKIQEISTFKSNFIYSIELFHQLLEKEESHDESQNP
jgi:hypothetical protein